MRPISVSASAPSKPHMLGRKAFTLLELLLVVVIIGIVYGLVINSMKRINDKEANLGFETLPSFLEAFYHQNRVAFVCTDNCRSCSVHVDGKKVKEVDAFMAEERVLRFWRFDLDLGPQEIRFSPVFDEDDREFDVCFRYEIFEDGSRSEMIVETQKEIYDYRGPFHPVTRHASLEALEESRQIEIQKVLR